MSETVHFEMCHISSSYLPSPLSPLSCRRGVTACVCVSAHYGASRHRSADRQRATHLCHFPKNSWAAASALAPAQSASISRRPARVFAAQTVCSRGFLLIHYVIVIKSPFPLIRLPTVAKSFHDQTSSDLVLFCSESLSLCCYFQLHRTTFMHLCSYTTI